MPNKDAFLLNVSYACRPKVILTASGGLRGTKTIELKQIVDDACALTKGKFTVSIFTWPLLFMMETLLDPGTISQPTRLV